MERKMNARRPEENISSALTRTQYTSGHSHRRERRNWQIFLKMKHDGKMNSLTTAGRHTHPSTLAWYASCSPSDCCLASANKQTKRNNRRCNTKGICATRSIPRTIIKSTTPVVDYNSAIF